MYLNFILMLILLSTPVFSSIKKCSTYKCLINSIEDIKTKPELEKAQRACDKIPDVRPEDDLKNKTNYMSGIETLRTICHLRVSRKISEFRKYSPCKNNSNDYTAHHPSKKLFDVFIDEQFNLVAKKLNLKSTNLKNTDPNVSRYYRSMQGTFKASSVRLTLYACLASSDYKSYYVPYFFIVSKNKKIVHRNIVEQSKFFNQKVLSQKIDADLLFADGVTLIDVDNDKNLDWIWASKNRKTKNLVFNTCIASSSKDNKCLMKSIETSFKDNFSDISIKIVDKAIFEITPLWFNSPKQVFKLKYGKKGFQLL